MQDDNQLNAGFFRDEALLGIFVISDEDDCSVNNLEMFANSNASLNDPLGPLNSYRCFEFGVRCEPDRPREEGAKDGCTPRVGSRYMPPTDFYADAIVGIKPDRELDFVVGAAIGPPGPVMMAVASDDTAEKAFLLPSCILRDSEGLLISEASPAIRLHHFLDRFPYNTRDSICQSDFLNVMAAFAAQIAHGLESPCLSQVPADFDVVTTGRQYDCSATEDSGQGTLDLPECSNPDDPPSSAVLPCFVLSQDPAICTASEGYFFAVHRNASLALDATVRLTCFVRP